VVSANLGDRRLLQDAAGDLAGFAAM